MQEANVSFLSAPLMIKKKPLWMTGKVLRSVKTKHKLWKKWKECNDDTAYDKYRKPANKASKGVKMAKREFERKIWKNIKKDSKSFYAYTRSKSRVKNSVGPLIGVNGSLASTDEEMGDLLNAFFASVFTQENIDYIPAVKQQYQGEENGKLCSFSMTPDMVKSKLQKLKMNKPLVLT